MPYCLLQDGETPLSVAIEKGRDDIVKMMAEGSANINVADEVSLLYFK